MMTTMDTDVSELQPLLDAANAARWHGYDFARSDDAGAADAEQRLDERFQTRHRLAVYGTLAPGKPNHHVVAPLGGEWSDGVIEGELMQTGWGAAMGYAAFRPLPGAGTIAVKLLTAPALDSAWDRLDDFEGEGYRRILVPIFAADDGERRLITVANLYAAAEAARGAEG